MKMITTTVDLNTGERELLEENRWAARLVVHEIEVVGTGPTLEEAESSARALAAGRIRELLSYVFENDL